MIDTLAEAPLSGPTPIDRLKGIGLAILRPIVVVILALLVGMVIILFTHQDPLVAYENLLIEPFKSSASILAMLFYAIPLVLTGLAAAVAFRANIFNIGGEGQLQIGALLGAAAALYFAKLPAVVLVPLVVVVGAIGGALWASIAGWIRAYWGATELVSTIMLNYVAIDIAAYMISSGAPLAASNGAGTSTNTIPSSAWFATIGPAGSQFHWGVIVPIAAALLVFALLYVTPLGYEIRMVGANAPFAQYGGVAVPRVITGKNQVSLPTRGLRRLGWEKGDRLMVQMLGDDMMVLTRRPESWADAFSGKMGHVFGTHEDTMRFLAEERHSWEEWEESRGI